MKAVIKIFKISKKNSKRILVSLYIFGILWFSFEFALRFAGVNGSYNEKQGLFYTTGFLVHEEKELKNQHILVHQPYSTHSYLTKEFNYEHKYNNEGLRDIDHSLTKDSNEFRIICIGNSFTEGIGTPQDSTWPKLLENLLIPCSKKEISVFNAGIFSSDPFFEYMLLSERMLKYEPDIVLVALGSSDLIKFRFRGGFERFTPDGLRYRKGPKWEKLYAVSYIVRYFVVNLSHFFDDNYFYDNNYSYFMSPSEYKAEKSKALHNIHQCVIRFYNLSLKHKFKLAIVFYDDRKNDYKPLIEQLKMEKTIPIIDLFEYNRNIEKITDQNRWKYYWKIDDHNNSQGYLMFARGVKWNLEKMEMIDSIK